VLNRVWDEVNTLTTTLRPTTMYLTNLGDLNWLMVDQFLAQAHFVNAPATSKNNTCYTIGQI
jgi:hypothetical protein